MKKSHVAVTVKKARSARKKSTLKPPPNLHSWNTTDTEEIAFRRFRAQTEPSKMQVLEKEHPYFGTFEIRSKASDTRYQVEIRSLEARINSCDCLDYQRNYLGVCKHIEGVLLRLEKRSKHAFRAAALKGSTRIEIYLDRQASPCFKIAYPSSKVSLLKKEPLAPIFQYFDAEGYLKGEALKTIPEIRALIAKLSPALLSSIRCSKHFQDVLQEQVWEKQHQKTRSQLEAAMRADPGFVKSLVKYPLYPYQEQGMLHLALRQCALLADDMGLGKTVQAIAAAQLLYQQMGIQKVLVIATASLKAEWAEQIQKFSDQSFVIVQGTRTQRLKQYACPSFFYLCNYEQILVDQEAIQEHMLPDLIILDEAQRIKNWQTKTAQAVKGLKSPYRFILTGTPLENRLDDLYSLIEFLDPQFFGALFRFNRDFYQVDEEGRPIGYKNLDLLHKKLQGIMLRRCKEEVEGQLPNRRLNTYFVKMDPEQRMRYEVYEGRVARLMHKCARQALRKEEYEKLQRYLACMRMICDTPYILDPECKISPKLVELKNLLPELLEDPGTKIIVFSEWERMLELVRDHCESINLKIAWHTGRVPQIKRRQALERFKQDPACRLFLSTDAGSLGLNLQVANVVINLDLPWNPAKLEQRIARAWRKHQTKSVQVINLVCENSIEHRMLHVLAQKQTLSKGVLEGAESLKEMALPSGRAAFIERMQELMGSSEMVGSEEAPPQAFEITPSANASEALLDEAKDFSPDTDLGAEGEQGLKVFQDTIKDWVHQAKRIAAFGDKVLLVVDSDDPKDLPENTESPQVLSSDSLERVDTRTFETIQRLIRAGILSLGAGTQILSTEKDYLESEQVLRERLEQAKACLKVAERHQRMAGVLIAQDFEEEAIVPLSQSFFKVLEACVYLGSEQKNLKKEWTRDGIQALMEKGYLVSDADFAWHHFQGAVEASILEIKTIQRVCAQCLKKVQSIQEGRDLKKQSDHDEKIAMLDEPSLLLEGYA